MRESLCFRGCCNEKNRSTVVVSLNFERGVCREKEGWGFTPSPQGAMALVGQQVNGNFELEENRDFWNSHCVSTPPPSLIPHQP